MSLFGALFSAVSGINSNASALAVISDNIANQGTVGYKRSTTIFESLVTGNASSKTYTPGGVSVNTLQNLSTQGLIQGSSVSSHLAISGEGWFIANTNHLPVPGDEFTYTRDGSFQPDNSGNLVNGSGHYLFGWRLDANGSIPTDATDVASLEAINIRNIPSSARETDSVQLGANLPAGATSGTVENTNITVFDSLGNPHDLRLTWTKGATPNTWELTASVTNGSISDVENDSNATTGNVLDGTGMNKIIVTFDTDGSPMSAVDEASGASVIDPDTGSIDIEFDFSSTGGATAQSIALNMGSFGTNTLGGLSQFAGDYFASFINQNGRELGSPTNIGFGEDGTVTVFYDNGERQDLYRIATATFASENNLERRSGNAYAQTIESGSAVIGEANKGGRGSIQASALELSTTDVGEEFSALITTQRSYSANASVMSKADDMLEELSNVVR